MLPAKNDAQALITTWITKFNERDIKGITDLYAPNAILWGTFSEKLISDEVGIHAYFKRALEGETAPTVKLGEYQTQELDSMLINSGYYSLQSLQNGQIRELPARFTFAYFFHKDQWLILNHHSSSMPNQTPLL